MQSKDDELKTQVSDSSLRELNSRLVIEIDTLRREKDSLINAELNTRIFELERSAKENEELRNRVAKLEQHQYIDTNTISLDDETNSNDTSEQIISCNEESNTLNSDIYQDSATTTSPSETISFASQSNLRRLEEKVENEFWDQELLSTPENTIPKISISPNKNASIHKAEKSLLNKDLNIQDTKLSSSESKSRDLSKWSPQNFPITKMKTDTIMKQLPNPIRFIIQHIKSWPENQIEKPICGNLYQDYLTWCGNDGEDRISNNKFGGFLPPIGIEKKQVWINGKREWVYILDRSKIVAKLRESVGDIEEFSDTPQAEISSNASTDIPVFDIPEIVTSPEPEKKISESSTTDRIKKGKDTFPAPPITNMTQELFDSIIDQPEYSVASSSKSTDISLPPEIEHVESVDDRSEPASEIIKPANDEVEPSPIESVENELRASNETPPQQISYPPGYQTREQREIRLRQKAIELGEDPEIFITITDKDKLDSIAFHDRMQTDARMCGYAKEAEENPSEYMDMTVRERLISEEIIRRSLEEDGITTSWLDTDEEWKKTINILQENGMLW
ncbi:13959_t:CDS:2 [Entrophospora sp. SA101]|nr:13959_t:CDS:2 [Entrophospora sp. SA101]